MKEHQMYPHNPNSAESILNEKLKDVSHGWVDNQRALVLEAMEQYAQQELQAYRDKLKAAISSSMSKEERLAEIETSLKYARGIVMNLKKEREKIIKNKS